MQDLAYRFDDSAAYERFMGSWSRAVGDVFLPWLSPPRDARWLDVGCGTGIFTKLIFDRAAPAEVFAVDPEVVQIDHARWQPSLRQANFRIADGCALPFAEAMFDIVASALVINFIPDRRRAISEMRRVSRPGGLIGGYIWDFAAEASPSWPLRRGLQASGFEAPAIAGTQDSNLGGLHLLFAQAGLEGIGTRSIEVAVSFPDFETFWQAQRPTYSPTTSIIENMSAADRARLIDAVRAALPTSSGGEIEYVARANAIKANVPK